jgi:hypothetical protein
MVPERRSNSEKELQEWRSVRRMPLAMCVVFYTSTVYLHFEESDFIFFVSVIEKEDVC